MRNLLIRIADGLLESPYLICACRNDSSQLLVFLDQGLDLLLFLNQTLRGFVEVAAELLVAESQVLYDYIVVESSLAAYIDKDRIFVELLDDSLGCSYLNLLYLLQEVFMQVFFEQEGVEFQEAAIDGRDALGSCS